MIKTVALTQQLCSFLLAAKMRDARLCTNCCCLVSTCGNKDQFVSVVLVLKYHYSTYHCFSWECQSSTGESCC